jgi:hypothetical protein
MHIEFRKLRHYRCVVHGGRLASRAFPIRAYIVKKMDFGLVKYRNEIL